MTVLRIPASTAALSSSAAILILIIGLAAPFDIGVLPQQAAGIALFAVLMWTLQPVPIEFSSLIILILLPMSGQLTFQETFGPFAGSTVWLVFAGMVLSRAVETTDLGNHFVARALASISHPSPFRLLLGSHALGLALAFLVPSGVIRVLLLTPIGMAIVRQIGAQEDRATRAAVHLSLVCSTYFAGSGILTGSVPNLVVVGQLELTTGLITYWGEFLEWMFPVMGLCRVAVSLIVIWIVIGRKLDHTQWRADAADRTQSPALDRSQRITMIILLTGVALWATDILHNLAPVYVGLILVAACTFPGGPLPVNKLREINFPFFFYLVALFALGTTLQKSGFNDLLIARTLQEIDMASYGWFGRHFAIVIALLPLDIFMDTGAVGGVATPAMIEFGMQYGLSDLAVAMSVVMATSIVVFPYQAAPLMVGLEARHFSIAQLVTCTAIIAILSVFVLCPVNIHFWHWLGLI